jgi:hypothetical protein
MADMTYCINKNCPFEDCERHPNKINTTYVNGKDYVSIANFDSVCRRYISHIVDEVERGTE